MDFIKGLSKNSRKQDSIMIVIDKLIKEAPFIPIKSTYKDVNIVYIFMKENFRLHGLPKVIISDKDANFAGNLLKYLFQWLGTQLNFSNVYHPQMDGHTKRVNQVLEYMLRM